MTQRDEPGLFDSAPAPPAPTRPSARRPAASLPEGFKYQAEFITPDEEHDLVRHVETLPLQEFQFHGFTGKRRVVSFGWRYDFNDRALQKADDIPPVLQPLRARAAVFAGLSPAAFQHVLVTEYAPGAAIGWHRDKAVFAEVVGVSLLSSCRFRFRRQHGDKWQRAAIDLAPRSMYLLAGPSRTECEHSIPAVEQLRYSITFRNFRDASQAERSPR
jgi:alkylated DNA repair dioxygenase AlkB